MRTFVIDSHGSAATGKPPHLYGVEWPDGMVTIRMSNPREPEPVSFRSVAGLEETANAKVRFLDPHEAEPKPEDRPDEHARCARCRADTGELKPHPLLCGDCMDSVAPDHMSSSRKDAFCLGYAASEWAQWLAKRRGDISAEDT